MSSTEIIRRMSEELASAALGFEKHARHWHASAARTCLIEDQLRAENAQALADRINALLATAAAET